MRRRPAYASVGRTWRMSPAARAACYAEFRRALAPVAEQAGELGVSIGVEALNRYETSVVNTIEQTIELIDGLPPNVGIMIDTYHMNIEEADPTRLSPPLARTSNTCRSAAATGRSRRGPLRLARFFTVLENTGYQGAICIESFTAENETIATAAAIWRPLAPHRTVSPRTACAISGRSSDDPRHPPPARSRGPARHPHLKSGAPSVSSRPADLGCASSATSSIGLRPALSVKSARAVLLKSVTADQSPWPGQGKRRRPVQAGLAGTPMPSRDGAYDPLRHIREGRLVHQFPNRRLLSLTAALLTVALAGCGDGTSAEGPIWSDAASATPTAAAPPSAALRPPPVRPPRPP
ncbi:sugar phosphate isomerase/epimerase family protein [Micromonospora sp. M12]